MPGKDKILVLDYGTTALKAVLFDGAFCAVSVRSEEFRYTYPHPDWVEYEPENYIAIALRLMGDILRETGAADELAAISVTGQSETIIPVDADRKPIGNAIVWIDTRPAEETAELQRLIDPKYYYEVTGIPFIEPVTPLAKLRWMKTHEPERFAAADKFLMLHDYVIARLSGFVGAEASVHCCTGYLDIRKKQWDKKLLEYACIDESRLPPVCAKNEAVGGLLPEPARAMGAPAGVPIVNGMLDQCASAIGAGNIVPGKLCETTGTVLAIAATLPAFDPDAFAAGPMTVVPHGLPGLYLTLPYCPTAGMLLKWYKEAFLQADAEKCAEAGEDVYKYVDEQIAAKGTPVTGLIALPHFSGYQAPVSNPDAVGVLYGLSLETDRFDTALALMEGVTFLLRENLELFEHNGIPTAEVVSLGGGAKSRLWCQLKADITGRTIVTLKNEESTALGCALGAALALGLLSGPEDVAGFVTKKRTFTPNAEKQPAYEAKYQKYLDLNRRLGFIR